MSENARELTFWEQAVWITFNPSWNKNVDKTKKMFAEIIDMINNTNDSVWKGYLWHTCRWMAIRACIEAQMAVVKFITFKEDA